MTWCAICSTAITGPVHREPLGRDEALVPVCKRCATESPREGRYSFGALTGKALRIGDGHSAASQRKRR